MEALLQQLIFMGWEVKRGKHIALRKPDQKRFKRMDSLGEDYTQEALVSIMQGNQPHAPKRKKSMNKKQEHRMALLADIQRKIRDRNSPAYVVNAFRAGDDVKTVQQNAGHYSAAFTLDRYAHVTETMRRESADRMQNFFEAL